MVSSPPQARGGFSATSSRGHLIPFAAFLATGSLLLLLNRIGPAQPSFPEGGREMLPSGFVTFQAKCANETVEDPRKFLQDAVFDGKDPFKGFPDDHIEHLLDQKAKPKGWGSKAPVFKRLMMEVRPRVVIEIGTFLGASAIHMASLAKDMGLQTLIICVDDFRGWPMFRQKFRYVHQLNGDAMLMETFMYNVKKRGLKDRIIPFPFSTAHSLVFFCEKGIQADLIEVDAGHDFQSAWVDINRAYKVLAPGGVMFGHDYFNEADNAGVQRAVRLFAQRNNLQIEPDGAHWILRPPDYKVVNQDRSSLLP